jgi:cytochrome P450
VPLILTHKVPGPAYAATTNLVYHYHCVKGNEISWVQSLHLKYGEVVRLGPDRLSYITPQAWRDVMHAPTSTHAENPKDTRSFGPDSHGTQSFGVIQDPAAYRARRKVYNPAFSEKALKLQEPLIKGYVDKLVRNLQDAGSGGDAIDMVRQFNFTTFDIMADMTFGAPLGLLDTSSYTPWVKAVFGQIKQISFSRLILEYPLLKAITTHLMSKSTKELTEFHYQHSAERVDKRLEQGADIGKPDIWSLIMQNEKVDLTKKQMYADAQTFMLAGTETTATVLSGLIYLLLKDPDAMTKICSEIRALSKEDLSLETLPRLTYMNACLEEALRIYPAGPIGFARQVAKGGNVVCGEYIPENVSFTRDAGRRIRCTNWCYRLESPSRITRLTTPR